MRVVWYRRLAVLVAALLGVVIVPAAPALAYYAVTDVAPAASSSGNRTMVLATDYLDGSILQNAWDLGSSGVWQVVSFLDSCPTTVSPAIALVNNGSYGFLLARCPGGAVYLKQGGISPGIPLYQWGWQDWQPMGVTTNVAPAAAGSGNRTVAVVTAPDGRILYDWWDLGGGGHGFREVPGGLRSNTTAAPALVSNGGYLFLLARGLDGQIYLNQGAPGGSFVGWRAMGVSSSVAPAAAASGNRSVALVTAPDGRVLYDWWDLGGGGHGFREVPGGYRTDAAVAGGLVNGGSYLFVLAKRSGSHTVIDVNQGGLGGNFVGWTQL